ncbi:nuclear pore complex protein-like protein Nup107 [Periconia macrospinosa]|uniref:Nuclear pore complex protein n=1 Tax=Periconia macrospinosa TaxID=97972 RepID=A0A2V1E064_9PLEO|nr:nuclear pore complex protein-like protein Nup107 [Periconia macrospinosa]
MASLLAPRRTASQASSFNALSFGASRSVASNAHTNDPLQPLRAMADRVGKEVEKFAERVDHWHTHGNEDQKAKHQTTVKMVGKFRDLAKSTVDELQRQHDSEHRGELDKSVRRRIHNMAPDPNTGNIDLSGRFSQSIVSSVEPGATPATSSMQELRQWQAELATWELVRVIIDHYYPEPGTNVAAQKTSRLARVGGDHSYSPKTEIWDRFIIADDAAREKKLILQWLQQTARNTESDIESIVSQWGQLSGKDTNTWTSGWLDTKVKIKQAKRMQGGLDKPLDDDYPLQSSGGLHQLITRLDPDAPAKQGRVLEKSDEYYENALWMVCYEMVRRGDSWEQISDWCKERNEAWRGVSLGFSHDSQPDGGPNLSGNDLGYLFRRVCLYAARGARIPYEGAVYALLAGDVQAAQAACRSWDDHLYAHYNALLLSRFDGFVQVDASRVSKKTAEQFFFKDYTALFSNWQYTNKEVIERLMDDPATSSQAKTPMKLIQGALISQNVEELMYKVGIAVADLQQNDQRLNLLMLDPDSVPQDPQPKMAGEKRLVNAEDYHQALVKDPHALRILSHIYIALYGGNLDELEVESDGKALAVLNVLTYYIEFLRVTKRLQLIPLYAAQLGTYRGPHCMARVLPDIKNDEEQKRCMDLMKLYGIQFLTVVNENFVLQLSATGYVQEKYLVAANPITRYALVESWAEHDAFLWPGVRVKHDLAGLDISPQEEAVIESLKWYNYIEDTKATFRDLYTALETFLLKGRIGAAEKLATEMSVEAISLTQTTALCGYAFDFTAPGSEEQDEQQVSEIMNASLRSSGNDSIRPSEIPNKQGHARQVLFMRKTSQKYGNLCQLVRLISLLREWRAEEENLIQSVTLPYHGYQWIHGQHKLTGQFTRRQRATDAKISTKNIKQLSGTIEAFFESVLDPKFDPTTDATIWMVYKAYVPEVIIAYLSVLQSGAFFIHRDTATKAMDVATIVADSEREWLQKVFLQTGRMKDFVTVVANVSKAMLKLGEHADGKTMTKKRDSKGQSLRIWDMTIRN